MASELASIASAVAGVAAAAAAFLSYRQQRRAIIDAIRPELSVERWGVTHSTQSYAEGGGDEGIVLQIDCVENIGRGPAFQVRSGYVAGNYFFETQALLEVRVGRRYEPRWMLILGRQEAAELFNGGGSARYQVVLWYQDAGGNHYLTHYDVAAGDRLPLLEGAQFVSRGFAILNRRTVFRSRRRRPPYRIGRASDSGVGVTASARPL